MTALEVVIQIALVFGVPVTLTTGALALLGRQEGRRKQP